MIQCINFAHKNNYLFLSMFDHLPPSPTFCYLDLGVDLGPLLEAQAAPLVLLHVVRQHPGAAPGTTGVTAFVFYILIQIYYSSK